MQEVFEKIIEELEELKSRYEYLYEKCNEAFGIYCKYYAEGNEVKGRDCCSSY